MTTQLDGTPDATSTTDSFDTPATPSLTVPTLESTVGLTDVNDTTTHVDGNQEADSPEHLPHENPTPSSSDSLDSYASTDTSSQTHLDEDSEGTAADVVEHDTTPDMHEDTEPETTTAQADAPVFIPSKEESAGPKPPSSLNEPYYRCPPQHALIRCVQQSLTFTGRASRSEYWWVLLVYAVVCTPLYLLNAYSQHAFGIILIIWQLITLVPLLSLSARRLHDANLHAAWLWAIIGGAIIAFACMTAGVAVILTATTKPLLTGGVYATIAGLIIMAITAIADIVLMVLPSVPAGKRFDATNTMGKNTPRHGGSPIRITRARRGRHHATVRAE